MKIRKWTAEEVGTVGQIYASRKPITEMASHLPDRTVGAIYNKARRLGLLGVYRGHIKVEGVKRLSDFERGWIAGLIDGDGSIALNFVKRKRKYHYRHDFSLLPSIRITNNNLELLEVLKKTIGGGICIQRASAKNKKWKDFYHWTLVGIFRIKSLLKQVLPDLIVRRPQAELILKYCTSRIKRLKGKPRAPYSKDEIELVHKMEVLNRGKGHK